MQNRVHRTAPKFQINRTESSNIYLMTGEQGSSETWLLFYQTIRRHIPEDTIKIHNYLYVNPLNAELNPTCHMLALLGAHHSLHISSIRVNLDPQLQ